MTAVDTAHVIDIPRWQGFLGPVLQVLSDGQERRRRAIYDDVGALTALTEEQMSVMLNSGQPTWENRIGWAISDLSKAEAILRPQRGVYTISDLGRGLLERHPDGVTETDLHESPAYVAYLAERGYLRKNASATPAPVDAATQSLSPQEQIEAGVAEIEADVAHKLLTRLHEQSPAFFEEAVRKLLVAMGYGGSDGTVTRTPLTNDGGIDVIIDQDALGLARIYVQAKRYALDSSVQRPDIQAFVGALVGNSATQGVFITTGRFSDGAKTYAAGVSARIVLIDGARLARLMIRYNVGVQVTDTYRVVKLDEDFFE